MSNYLNYDPDTYNSVVQTKNKINNLINQIYATLPNSTFSQKLESIATIDGLKQIKREYDNYVILYQRQLKQSGSQSQYVTKQGDTLQRVALQVTGNINNWQAIYKYNNLQDIILLPGTTLNIPDNF